MHLQVSAVFLETFLIVMSEHHLSQVFRTASCRVSYLIISCIRHL